MRNSKSALLSLKPSFANLLLSGIKKVELRKKSPSLSYGNPIVIYSTSPICAILGFCTVKRIIRATPENIWKKYGFLTGINEDEFWAYFGATLKASCLVIDKPQTFEEPVTLQDIRSKWPGFMPPQSFRYARFTKGADSVSLALTSYPGQEIIARIR